MIHSLPRNMNPVHNHGKRKARAKAFLSQLHNKENNLFVDASLSESDSFVATVVELSGRIISAASVSTKTSGVAKQVTVTLALTIRDPISIFSDSMTAIRSLDANQVSMSAHGIHTSGETYHHELTWFPAHMGIAVDGIANPNKLAHARARDLSLRLGNQGPPSSQGIGIVDVADWDPLTTFHEITCHYRLGRRSLPARHRDLTRSEEITLRLIQTETFPSPAYAALYTYIPPTTLPAVNWLHFTTLCGGAPAYATKEDTTSPRQTISTASLALPRPRNSGPSRGPLAPAPVTGEALGVLLGAPPED